MSDVVIPLFCPWLGISLRRNQGHVGDDSPTLDRLVPKRGYVKGNVIVISALANRIKNSGAVEQIRAVADGLQAALS